MRAIAISKPGKADDLIEQQLPKPVLRPHDILVQVKAVSINPVDYKVRSGGFGPITEPRVLGWDGAGVVVESGPEAKKFKKGDEVYFAGDVTRNGSNAEFVAVDERIVALKPKSLNWAQAASIPLVALTAWEGIHEGLHLHLSADHHQHHQHHQQKQEGAKKVILVIGGAGGVGSFVLQLAKHLSNLTVVATASRPESAEKVRQWGADHVIGRKNWKADLEKLGIAQVHYVFNTADVNEYFEQIAEVIAPLGKIVAIVPNPTAPIALHHLPLFLKKVSFHWEFMFTRSMFGVDLETQAHILDSVAKLVDAGVLGHRLTVTYDLWTQIKQAHTAIESGTAIGKIALTL